MTNPIAITGAINPYLDRNVVHVKPVSPRLFHEAQHLSISLSKIHFKEDWQNKTMTVLSKGLLVTSYLLTIPASLIEGLASGIFAMIGTFSQLVISPKSDHIEKYSVKAMAYSLHCLTTLAISITSLLLTFKKDNEWIPKRHITASMLSGTTYLSSAALTQLFGTVIFNSIRGKQDDSPIARSNQAIKEGTPKVFGCIAKSLQREYLALGNPDTCDTREYARDYVATHPPLNRDWVNNFDLEEFLEVHVLSGLSDLVEQYIQLNNFVEADTILSTDNYEAVLTQFNTAEQKYHDHLKNCVDEAVKLMHNNQWVKYIDIANNFEEGLSVLEFFMPEGTIPLSNIAQLIEVEREPCCPKTFQNGKLKMHNGRSEKLRELKPMLQGLSAEDKELLVEHLIKNSDFELGMRNYDNKKTVDLLYKKISILAGDFHQGSLMTLPTIDTETFEGGGHNYFGDSWREGVEKYFP